MLVKWPQEEIYRSHKSHLSHIPQYITSEQKCTHFCSEVMYCGMICALRDLWESLICEIIDMWYEISRHFVSPVEKCHLPSDNVFGILNRQIIFEINYVINTVVSTVPADGPAPSGVRASPGTAMTKFLVPQIYGTGTWRASLGWFMMTSPNCNIFRVTGHLCGKFTGHRWIPRIKASDAELWCFLWSAPE